MVRATSGLAAALVSALLWSVGTVVADDRVIGSQSLATCMDNSSISASKFNVVYTPKNNTLAFTIDGVSTISGNVLVTLEVQAYGYQVIKTTIDPCKGGGIGGSLIAGFCPMSAAPLNIDTNIQVPADLSSKIPGIAFSVPDIDGSAKIFINTTAGQVACVQAFLYNGKTVDQSAVAWVTAAIAGLALLISALMSGLGQSNTAVHIATSVIFLFGFFQSQAIYGMTAVHFPPIAASWIQNFVWSMGIIRIQFMQDILTWYIKSSGGNPSSFLNPNTFPNVLLQKRSFLDPSSWRRTTGIYPRADVTPSIDSATVFRGIKRVAYRSRIEQTNLFMTGYAFFIAFIVFVAIGVLLFRGLCEILTRRGQLGKNRFAEFRYGWRVVLKGIMYRLILIGYTQMTVLTMWELIQRDSIGAVVNAVLIFLAMTICLFYAAWRVIRLARRSMALHKSPAYILYSDPQQLNRWGFIYIQWRADCYYFLIPVLFYTLFRGIVVGALQSVPKAQAITLLVIELSLLVLLAWIKPYMNKRTNSIAIAIASVNFINAIILLFFSNLFPNMPPLANGILGVVFFVLNAAFALVLLIMVIVSCCYALFRRDQDSRYAPMSDDRAHYMKTNTEARDHELDALAAKVTGRDLPGVPVTPMQSPGDERGSNFGHKEMVTPNSATPAHAQHAETNKLLRTNNGDMWKRGVGYE